MEYISSKKLALAGINNDPERLFVSLWAELFNPDTIDTYRARVMNARSILHEVEEVVADRLVEQIDMKNVQFVCDEAVRLLTNDLVCQKHFHDKTRFTAKILKKARDEAKAHMDLIALSKKVEILRLDLDAEYLTLLIQDLQNAIFDVPDIEAIVDLTGSLATELVWRGFSNLYLYRRILLFLDIQQPRTFRERFTQFLSDIQQPPREFEVCLKFSGPADLGHVGKVFDIKIETTHTNRLGKEQEDEFEKLTGTLIATLPVIRGLDPFSAAQESLYQFWLLVDLIRFEYRKSEMLLTPQALVLDRAAQNAFLVELNPRPIGFQSAGSIGRLTKRIESLGAVLDANTKRVDDQSRDRLRNSFRYFRMSLEATVPESRFLHCWIALEFLLKTGAQSSIIAPIIQFVPKVLALQYLKKLLKDLSANIFRCNVNTNEIEKAGISIVARGVLKLSTLLEALMDTNRFKILLGASTNPLLTYRLNDLRVVFSDSKKTKERMVHHLEDLKWHLQRMYRVRNKIVHSASVGINLGQLESNLSYYFTTVFNNLLFIAQNSSSQTTIEQMLMKQDAAFDFLYDQVDAGQVITDLLLRPKIAGIEVD